MLGNSGVNSYDEWTRLQEVIVGRAENYFSHDLDTSFRLFYYDNVRPTLHGARGLRTSLEIPAYLVDELQEDIEGFVTALTDCRVNVLRPALLKEPAVINSPHWTSRQTPPLNVRDQTIILGNTILETAPHVRSRYFENDYLKPAFYCYLRGGSRWLAMPRPALVRGSLDPGYFVNQGIDVSDVMADLAGEIPGIGYELIFDGAQCIRVGRDVLVNVASENHRLALSWLNANFSDTFRFHQLDAIADSHIDSIIVPLRPGLVLLRSPEYRAALPKAMQKWDAIYAPQVSEDHFPNYSNFGFNIASRYIDINVLSVDEDTVIVNSLCPELIKLLEEHGITAIPVRHRHRRLFGGGFHCFTLDTVRSGGCENYLD